MYPTQDIQISDPMLEMQGERLIISYDILNSLPTDRFNIRLELSDENDDPIDAKELTGDVGRGVTGGTNKKIIWDLKAEGILIQGSIYAKIVAWAEPGQRLEEPVQEIAGSEEFDEKQFSRTGLVLQSLAFPGLGLTRYKGKPHWIKGVAGYGCIAGSILLNRKAIQTYSEIREFTSFEEKEAHFDQSVRQDNISEALAYSAIAIWVADFIWTVAGTSELKKIGVSAGLDPVTNAPLIGLNYRF